MNRAGRNALILFIPVAVLIFICIIQLYGMKPDADKPVKKPVLRDKKRYLLNNVYVPKDYRLDRAGRIRFKQEDIYIDLYAKKFSPGNAVYIEVYKSGRYINKELSFISLKFSGKAVPMMHLSWGFRGLTAIHPETDTGEKEIRLKYSIGGKKRNASYYIKILRKKFPYFKRPMDLGKYSNVEFQHEPGIAAFIKECSRKKREVFRYTRDDLLGQVLSHPRDMHYITSPFWARRVVMQYKIRNNRKIRLKNRIKIHRGLDLRGKTGSSVYAIADGRIVLSEEMFYEGNMIVIDHGNRVFSYYMHLSRIMIKKKRRVRAGELIGLVGSTGLSTAPHLHVSLMIRGTQVDPMSLLSLPIRN